MARHNSNNQYKKGNGVVDQQAPGKPYIEPTINVNGQKLRGIHSLTIYTWEVLSNR